MEKFNDLKYFLLEHKYLIIGGISVFIILILILVLFYPSKEDNSNNEIVEDILTSEIEELVEETCLVTVDIKGEVNNPGLYQLECGSRVDDAIKLAGGLTNNSDTSVINLSKKIEDEMVIIIYTKEEVSNFTKTKEIEQEKSNSCQNSTNVKNNACITSENIIVSNNNSTNTNTSTKVSLNNATLEELLTLSGIGESKANLIINYRNENGGFKTIDEIKNVKGIGDKLFEKIKDNITI